MKKSLTLLLAIILCFCMYACNNKDQQQETVAEETASKETVLTVDNIEEYLKIDVGVSRIASDETKVEITTYQIKPGYFDSVVLDVSVIESATGRNITNFSIDLPVNGEYTTYHRILSPIGTYGSGEYVVNSVTGVFTKI